MTKVFTPHDLLALETLAAARIAPDGSGIVYELKHNDMEEDAVKTNLWLWREQGGCRQLTHSGKDSGAAWSPDSRRVAFVSGRSGKSQIHILDVAGGEAKPIKTEREPSAPLKWSPDGTKIAFTSVLSTTVEAARYCGEPEELWKADAERLKKLNEGKKEDPEKKKAPPVKVITTLDYRMDGIGFNFESTTQLFVLDISTGECKQISNESERMGDFAWKSNDELVYCATRVDRDIVNQVSKLTRINLSGDVAETAECEGGLNNLSYSPDGVTLLMGASPSVSGIPPQEIKIWLNGDKEPRSLTAGSDIACSQPKWGPDGKSIVYLKVSRGTMLPVRADFTGGAITQFEPLALPEALTMVDDFSVSATGTLAFTASGCAKMPQLYKLEGGKCDALTNVNSDWKESLEARQTRILSFKGPDDWDVEGFMLLPDEGQAPYPTIVEVHGGPTGCYFRNFVPQYHIMASQGYAVLYVNPRGSTSYGRKFTQAIVGDWGGKDYQDIMAGVQHAVDLGLADPGRLGLTGWSYGGYMTCWAVTQTGRFKAAVGGANISSIYNLYGNSDIGATYDETVMGGPAFDLEELYMSRSALRFVRNVTTPIMLVHGESDFRCPIDQSEMYYRNLKRLGKTAVFIRYPEQYHGLRRPSYILDRWQREMGWFDHYVKGQ